MQKTPAPADLERALAKHAPDVRLSGGATVLSAAPGAKGGRDYEVSTTALLPVDDGDPELREVCIPVPVTARVATDAHGSIVGAVVPAVDAEAAREARAFARGLIQNGAVRGLPPSGRVRRSPGPPVRPTHELVTESNGAKVIRRVGFSAR